MSSFARTLLHWHRANPRPLPWSVADPNPYHIWLSEIIMQQTRIEQGTAYYLNFVNRYPTIEALAAAPIDDIMQLWEGLGYYTRARNLHKAANQIVHQLNGRFPDSFDALLTLPGIGPYSAAAISSFAYGLPHVAVDGNVKRLISRYMGVMDSIDDPKTHAKIHDVATRFMNGAPPAIFNQAIMNFGALICKPYPLCSICPLQKKCYAFQHEMVDALPVRSMKKQLRERFLHFIVLRYKDTILLQKREEKDIWQGLYALPCIETNSIRSPGKTKIGSEATRLAGHSRVTEVNKVAALYEQTLSHQLLKGRFYHYNLKTKPIEIPQGCRWVTITDLAQLGKPRIIVQYFEDLFK